MAKKSTQLPAFSFLAVALMWPFHSMAQALPSSDKEGIGFVCQGAFHPLSPANLMVSRPIVTQMQEAKAPQALDLNRFNGQLIRLRWQVIEGATLWGVVATPIAPENLKMEILPKNE